MSNSIAEEIALNYATAIHKEWENPQLVASFYRQLKTSCITYQFDYNVVLKRVGDYMRECFDREPKTRDVPLEQAITYQQRFVDYWKMEM